MINEELVNQLVDSNSGKRGYTYTHHKLSPSNVSVLKDANENGFTVNASCESLEQVDAAMALGLPAVVVVPSNQEAPTHTPAGNQVKVCPAQTQDDMTCAKCKLCSVSNRSCAVAFLAHGNKSKEINNSLLS